MDEMYSIDRAQLAQMIAAHTCGIVDAIPEDVDFDIADAALAVIEGRIQQGG